METITLKLIKSENDYWDLNESGEVLKQAEFALPDGVATHMHGYGEMRVDLVDVQNAQYLRVCTDSKGNPFLWMERKRVYLEEK